MERDYPVEAWKYVGAIHNRRKAAYARAVLTAWRWKNAPPEGWPMLPDKDKREVDKRLAELGITFDERKEP